MIFFFVWGGGGHKKTFSICLKAIPTSRKKFEARMTSNFETKFKKQKVVTYYASRISKIHFFSEGSNYPKIAKKNFFFDNIAVFWETCVF